MTISRREWLTLIPRIPFDEGVVYPLCDWPVNIALVLGGVGKRWSLPLFDHRTGFYLNQFQMYDIYEQVPNPLLLWDVQLDLMEIQSAPGRMGRWPGMALTIEMFPSMFTAPGGVVPMPGPDDRLLGLHSVFVTGVRVDGDGTRYLSFIHNLGEQRPGWGDEGTGYLSEAYVKAHFAEAWIMRKFAGPKLLADGDVAFYEPINDWKAMADVSSWDSSDSSLARTLSGYDEDLSTRLVVRRCESLAGSRPLFIFESQLRMDDGEWLRIGWMNVVLQPGSVQYEQPSVAIIHDLFVWPHFREKLRGSLLAYFVAVNLRELGWDEYVWLGHRADDLALNRGDFPPRVPRWLEDLAWLPVSRGREGGDDNLASFGPSIAKIARGSFADLEGAIYASFSEKFGH